MVGGIDPAERPAGRRCSTRRRWSRSCRCRSCEVAEACKILENTYRSVNIAMVNELKMLFDRMGIDVWEVIDAAKTKPFGFQAFYPGPGLGRALHPDRPVLPELAGPQARHDHAVHRAGRRDQHEHAAVRGPPGDRGPERARQAAAGQQGLRAGRGLQEGRRRSAREPVVRADGAAAGRRRGAQLQRPAHPAAADDAAPPRCRTWQARR